MAFVLGLVVIVVSLGIGIFAAVGTTGVIGFLNVPSLIIVLVPALIFLLTAAPWERVKLSLSLVFSSEKQAGKDEVQAACALLNSFGVVGLLFAIIGMLTGLILMASDLSHPERIGTNMSIAMISIYYGVLLRLLCYLATKRIQNRLLIDN